MMREAAHGRSLEKKFPAEEVASARPREREEFGDFEEQTSGTSSMTKTESSGGLNWAVTRPDHLGPMIPFQYHNYPQDLRSHWKLSIRDEMGSDFHSAP